MPPRRPLTDLCLIVIFKQLKPKNQLKASKVSFRCKVLVRAANRRVKTLAISYRDNVEEIKENVNKLSIAFSGSMQLTTGEPYLDYPTTNRLSEWNCLCVERVTPNIEMTVYIFSAVTDLKLIACKNYYEKPDDDIETFFYLLNHPQWTGQLINLFCSFLWALAEQTPRIIYAINRLSALQHLAIIFHYSDTHDTRSLENLTILAQLKIVLVGFECESLVEPFLRSLVRHASENVDLQVHLLNYDNKKMFSISEPLCSRFVRYGLFFRYASGRIPYICDQFSSLTSVDFICEGLTEIGPMFTAFTQLKKLVHLELFLKAYEDNPEELPRLLVQLPSVRSLDMCVHNRSRSHFHLEYLNLSWTLPNCQAIHIGAFLCAVCSVYFNNSDYKMNNVSLPVCSKALECYRKSGFHKLHRDVHPKKIILSLEKLPLDQLNITDQ